MPYGNDVVTSSQNKYVSLTRALSDRKNREKHGLYRFDGVKLLCEALSKGVDIEFVIVCDTLYDSVLEKAERLYGIDRRRIEEIAVTVCESVFVKISEENAPEGVICAARYDRERHTESIGDCIDTEGNERILIIESVRDPQNVGAMLRTAAAFGVERVIMSKDCADIYNSKTVRASMGSLFSVRVERVGSVELAVRALTRSGRRVFAAALDKSAARLGELKLRDGDCVVIGNEGHGLSETVISACTGSVFIPMTDKTESLNAATAAAILVWEFFGKSMDQA